MHPSFRKICIKSTIFSSHPANNELPDLSIKLRRQHAGMREQGFFSTDDRELHHGTYDLTDNSNEDLARDLLNVGATVLISVLSNPRDDVTQVVSYKKTK